MREPIFDHKVIDTEAFRASGSLSKKCPPFDRHIVLKCRDGNASLECYEHRKPTFRCECAHGDINLLAQCLATGEDLYNPFAGYEASQAAKRGVAQLFEHTALTRTLYLAHVADTKDSFTLTAKGLGVPGGMILCTVADKDIRLVGSRLLTGTFL